MPLTNKEIQKRYREKNKKQILERKQQYNKNNREKINQQNRSYYQANIEEYRKRNRDYANKKRSRTRHIYRSFMKDQQCNRCGYADYRALVWHHIDQSSKINGISGLIKQNKTIDIILQEIDKCECLCQNCHHIEHYLDR
jgi:predicted Zn-ribbon and HTH transcriptional regulator